MTESLLIALSLLDQGIATIPVNEKKIPIVSTWRQLQSELPAEADLEGWFKDNERLAVIGGKVQCLDVDEKVRAGLWESFKERCQEVGLGDVLKKPILQKTVNNGYHLIFTCKDVRQSANGIAKMRKDAKGNRKGLFDFKAGGGYFLVWPSPGYEIKRGDFQNIPELTAEERDELLLVAKSFDEPEPVETYENKTQALDRGKTPGDDYDAQAATLLPALLKKHGWRQTGEKYWLRPGKGRGVSATWGHVAINGEPRFWVWSSSTPFRVEHAYRAWHVYAVLEHDGDFEAAAKQLAREGYGEPLPSTKDKPTSNTLADIPPPQPPAEEDEEPVYPSPAEQARAAAERSAKAAAEIEAMSGEHELPPIFHLFEERDEHWPTPPEIIKGILYQGAKMMIAGPSKARKTFLLTDLALSVGTGSHWLGFPTTQVPVLYLNFELQNFASRRRTKDIQADKFANAPGNPLVYFWHLRGALSKRGVAPQVIYGQIVKRIRDFALNEGVGLIIIDPVYKLMQLAGEENNAEDVGRMLNEIEALTQETGAAVAFCHHFAKGNAAGKDSMDRASGSGVFARDPDALLTMTPHEEEDCMILEANLRNFRAPEPAGIRWDYPTWQRDISLDPEAFKEAGGSSKGGRPKKGGSAELESLLNRFGGQVTRENCRTIAEAMGVSERTVWNRWKEYNAETAN